MNIQFYVVKLRADRRNLSDDSDVAKTRETSLALTKLDEAIMWLESAQRAVEESAAKKVPS